MDLRPMRPDDVLAVIDLMHEAFVDLDTRHGRDPDPPPDPAPAAIRFHHLLETDPGGCQVAEDAEGLAAAAAALVRDGLWGLSLLVVHPRAQGTGLGTRLLADATTYGAPHRGGLIVASDDPRALRAYASAGFEHRPCVEIGGVPARPPRTEGVRRGDRGDVPRLDGIDVELRAARRGRDLEAFLRAGLPLLVDEEGEGYAVAHNGRLRTVAARDDATAARLLRAAFATAAPGAPVSAYGVPADQGWALDVAHELELEVEDDGALFVRGELGRMRPYIPSGAYL